MLQQMLSDSAPLFAPTDSTSNELVDDVLKLFVKALAENQMINPNFDSAELVDFVSLRVPVRMLIGLGFIQLPPGAVHDEVRGDGNM